MHLGEMNKRPITVTFIACLYLAVGAAGFVFHSREILARHAFHLGDAMVEVTELIALACGLFLLRGQNWARWLAAGWMAFHVAISFDSKQKLVVHVVFFVLIVYSLFRSDATAYFRKLSEGG